MNATYGLFGSGSSESAALQSSLASRLRARTASTGSTLFRLTWKVRDTPSQRPIFAQRALVLRTPGKDSTSWPSPTASSGDYYYRDGDHDQPVLKLPGAAKLSHWPTPMAVDGEKNSHTREGAEKEAARRSWNNDLGVAAQACNWPTPRTSDANGSGEHGTGGQDLRTTASSLVGDSSGEGLEGRRAYVRFGPSDAGGGGGGGESEARGAGPPFRAPSGAFLGAVRGFWEDAEWIYCTDGKWRPTGPGLFPLAHGVPNRLGTLRGAGNAIVPWVAAGFVSAVMEILAE